MGRKGKDKLKTVGCLLLRRREESHSARGQRGTAYVGRESRYLEGEKRGGSGYVTDE